MKFQSSNFTQPTNAVKRSDSFEKNSFSIIQHQLMSTLNFELWCRSNEFEYILSESVSIIHYGMFSFCRDGDFSSLFPRRSHGTKNEFPRTFATVFILRSCINLRAVGKALKLALNIIHRENLNQTKIS